MNLLINLLGGLLLFCAAILGIPILFFWFCVNLFAIKFRGEK